MGRKRKSQLKNTLYGFGIAMLFLYAFIKGIAWSYTELIRNLTQAQLITIIFLGILFILIIGFIIYSNKSAIQKSKTQLQTKINILSPSLNRMDYVISSTDYKRGNKKESFYRRALQLRLLGVFNNSCAKCGSDDNGIEIDHFMFSKNDGGCFIMIHKENYYVNNAIPLCQTCNKSKGDIHFKKFFKEIEISRILEKNIQLTKYINEKYVIDKSGIFRNKVNLAKVS